MTKFGLRTTGQVAAAQLRAHRTSQRLSLRELAERVSGLGHDLPLSAISKIESGKRRMDVDDLTALAAALGVGPANLLVLDTGDETDPLTITGASGSTEAVWGWVTGQFAVPGERDWMPWAARATPAWLRRQNARLDQIARAQMRRDGNNTAGPDFEFLAAHDDKDGDRDDG